MFGIRADGRLEKKIDPIVRMTSYIMPQRYDAQVFCKRTADYDIIDDYVKEKRRQGIRITHMDVIIAAYIRTVKQKPELNRFVVNSKIYKRNEIAVCLTILKDKTDGKINETVIKVKFKGDENIFEIKEKMNSEIEKNRKPSESNATDRLCNFLLAIPLLPGAAIGFIKWMDKMGLLPKWIIDASPFHTSMFITNLASIRMGYVYHHIYDFGTTSVFISMGQKETQVKLDKENNPVIRNVMPLGIVTDERICSGAEYSAAFAVFEKYLKNPVILEE